jgi:nucleoid-associated protein YgaU
MPVYTNSRYAGGLVLMIQSTRNGITKKRPYLYTRRPIGDVTIVRVYPTAAGDRLDILAHRFSGDSSLWWIIADVNRMFGFPLFLPVGTPLMIPSLSDFKRLGGA